MTASRWIAFTVWAVGLGLLVALFTGQDQVISVTAWVAAAASVTGLLVATAAQQSIPPAHTPIRPLFARRRRPAHAATRSSRLPLEIQSVEATIGRALTNPRAHDSELRPRLEALVQARGVDPDHLTEDLRGLIESTGHPRSPTLLELNQILDAATITQERKTASADDAW